MGAIGIDIGGTTTRVGWVEGECDAADVRRFETPRSLPGLLDELCSQIRSIRESAPGADRSHGVIGIAVAGLVDPTDGRVLRSVNLPFLEGDGFATELTRRSRRGIRVFTDADACAWGEYCTHSPRRDPFVHLRLGTGVACGVICGGQLQSTSQPRSTHWDVLVVDRTAQAPTCPCGLRGCLEAVAAGPAIARQAASAGLDPALSALQMAWTEGDPRAHRLIDETANALIAAISNLNPRIGNSTGSPPDRRPALFPGRTPSGRPAAVCLGGGVIDALPCLLERLTALWNHRGYAATTDAALHPTRLGDNAGVIGAALLARRPIAPR